MRLVRFSVAVWLLTVPARTPAQAQGRLTPPWDSVASILKTNGAFSGGYYRYGFPRTDLSVRIGTAVVAPGLALGTWAGFFGDRANATMIGDLVLTAAELSPVEGELARNGIGITAIHNHLAGESPQLTYVHYLAEGEALDLARRLSAVLERTATPRPVRPALPPPVTIDTSAIFRGLGASGKAQGNLVMVTVLLVRDTVRWPGRTMPPGTNR
ncbi:MAG: DUF1259 domain-containing protein [Gemmatimonadetes bacterium]|nr:DUF1259 domain-containing protein [Gemmatimonadota bacterium]